MSGKKLMQAPRLLAVGGGGEGVWALKNIQKQNRTIRTPDMGILTLPSGLRGPVADIPSDAKSMNNLMNMQSKTRCD